MQKQQYIRTKTKGGLLAAFECARDFYGVTNITLKRKTGNTFFSLSPYILSADNGESFLKSIKKSKKKIKQISAKDLLL